MKLVNFEIERIYAGWFNVCFWMKEKDVHITASDAWEFVI